MPRVKDVTKNKKKKKKKLMLDEPSDNESCEKQEASKVRYVVHFSSMFSLKTSLKNLCFHDICFTFSLA